MLVLEIWSAPYYIKTVAFRKEKVVELEVGWNLSQREVEGKMVLNH